MQCWTVEIAIFTHEAVSFCALRNLSLASFLGPRDAHAGDLTS